MSGWTSLLAMFRALLAVTEILRWQLCLTFQGSTNLCGVTMERSWASFMNVVHTHWDTDTLNLTCCHFGSTKRLKVFLPHPPSPYIQHACTICHELHPSSLMLVMYMFVISLCVLTASTTDISWIGKREIFWKKEQLPELDSKHDRQ